jgi:hypothetical protein
LQREIYHDRLQEIDNTEIKLSTEVANIYVEYANVGAGTGGGCKHTSELKPIQYKPSYQRTKWKSVENQDRK